MDFLNNLNVIISIIAGLVTIVTALGSVKFLQKKATSSKQVVQLSSSLKQTSYQVVPNSLNKLDWMEVLWKGFEDSIRAREGKGWCPIPGIMNRGTREEQRGIGIDGAHTQTVYPGVQVTSRAGKPATRDDH